MRRRLVECTLMITLLFVAPRARAATLTEPADNEPSDVATIWFDTLYDVVKSEAAAFPEAGRIYGVSAVALYDEVHPSPPLVNGIPSGTHPFRQLARYLVRPQLLTRL